MAGQSRFAVVLGLVLVILGTVGCASKGDLEQAQQSLSATKVELARAKADLAAAAQRVAALEEQGKAAQEAAQKALAQVQGDLSNVTRDTTALKTNVTTLQSDVGRATKEISTLGTDLTAAENSVEDLKKSFGLTSADVTKLKGDVTKLTTTDPKEEQASLLAAFWVLYGMGCSTTITNCVAARPTLDNIIKAIGDASLSTAWDDHKVAWDKWRATTPGSAERTAALSQRFAKEAVLLSRLFAIATQ